MAQRESHDGNQPGFRTSPSKTGLRFIAMSALHESQPSRISSVIEGALPRLLVKTARNLLCLAVGPLLVSCAAPNSEPPTYYVPPSSGEASVRPAIIEGT